MSQPNANTGNPNPKPNPSMEYRTARHDTTADESKSDLLSHTTYDDFEQRLHTHPTHSATPSTASTLILNKPLSGPLGPILRQGVLKPYHEDPNIHTHQPPGQQEDLNASFRPISPNTSTPRLVQIPRPDPTFDDDLEELIQKINAFKTKTTPPSTPINLPIRKTDEPVYMSSHEQFLKSHKDDLKKVQQTSDLLSTFSEVIAKQAQIVPDRSSIALAQSLLEKSLQYKDEGRHLQQGIQRAQDVVKFYNKSIPTPVVSQNTNQHVMLRDIISLTGYFDPDKDNSEFRHVWLKLYDYGKIAQFSEENYIQSLSAILKGEAYEALCELREKNSPLTEVLDYFMTIYSTKRSIVSDQNALDNFVRKKNEPIKNCMERCKMIVDKLRHTYSDQSWPEMRQLLIKQTIMQLILPDTKIYVTTKENYTLQTTGFHFPLNQLINVIDTYENINSKVPKFQLSQISKNPLAGKKEIDPDALASQVAHLKQDQKKTQKLEQENEYLKNIISANYTRNYKNEDRADKSKERRKNELEQRRAASRSSSLDRARQITPATATPVVTPITPLAFQEYQKAYERARSQSPFTRTSSQNKFRTETPDTPKVSFRTEENKEIPRTPNNATYSNNRLDNRPRSDQERGRSPYRGDRFPRNESQTRRRDSTPYPGYNDNYDRYRSNSGRRLSPQRYRDDYNNRRNDDYNSRRSNNYNNSYRSRSQSRYGTPYIDNRRSSSYNNGSYQPRSGSGNFRSQTFHRRDDKDPHTEKLTFSNEAKTIVLTMVEKPNLN